MNRGWNALVDHLPEISNPRGFLRAALMVVVPFGVAIAVLWFLRPVSAMLTVVGQLAVLALAHYLLADFFHPGRRAYTDAFFNRFLPVVGLHGATLAFILFSSAAGEIYELVVPPPVNLLLFLYLAVTGAALLWRAVREAGVATLCGLFVYFPEDDGAPITGSVYNRIRHPVYGGLARVALAFAALNGTAFALVLALIFVFIYQPLWIDLEEAELRGRFGEDYASFAAGRPALFPSSAGGEIDLVRRAFMGAASSKADAASA